MAKESGLGMSVAVDDSGGSAQTISNDITNFDWATRTCRGCQHIEVYLYDKDRGGAFWERVS